MQIAGVEAQSARRSGPVALALFQCLLDKLTLIGVQCCFQWQVGGFRHRRGGFFGGGRLQVEVQMRCFQCHDSRALGAATECTQGCAADDMFQFADIAGPGVVVQGGFGARGKAQAAQSEPGAIDFQKISCQQLHVADPLA